MGVLDGLVRALDAFAVVGLHLSLYLGVGLVAVLVLVLLANVLLLRSRFVLVPGAVAHPDDVPPRVAEEVEAITRRLAQVPALHGLRPVGWRRIGAGSGSVWASVLRDGTTIVEVGMADGREQVPVMLLTSFVADGGSPRRVASNSQPAPDLGVPAPTDVDVVSVRSWSPEALAALHGANLAGRRPLPLPADPMSLIAQGEQRAFDACVTDPRFRRRPDGAIRLSWWGAVEVAPRVAFAKQGWAKRRHDRRATELLRADAS